MNIVSSCLGDDLLAFLDFRRTFDFEGTNFFSRMPTLQLYSLGFW